MNRDVQMLGYLSPAKKHTSERVISPDGCCFTLLAMTHGYGQGYIMEYEKDTDRQNSEDRTRRLLQVRCGDAVENNWANDEQGD